MRAPTGAGVRRTLMLLFGLCCAVPALAVAPAPEPAEPVPPEIRGLDGRKLALVPDPGKVTAVVFYSTECPISNGYSPTLNAIVKEFPATSFAMIGVCSDPDISDDEVAHHAKEYQLAFSVARDRNGILAARLGVKVTPEAVVIDDRGRIRYRGRIDDEYAGRRKRNANPKTHELRDAIAAVLAGKEVAVASVPAVGCPLPEPVKAVAGPTFTRDVAPILQKHCQECHRAGQVGPFPLATYEQARKRAGDIAAVVEDRAMPPFKAVRGFGPRYKHDRSLTDPEVATIVAWAESGAPEGNPAHLPPPPRFNDDWSLGTPDLVVVMPEPFSIPASGDDIYQCFVLKTDLPQDTYIAAIEYRPGNRRVVHHILAYVDTSGQARKLDGESEEPGYRCFSGPRVETHGDLGGWAPGNEPSRLPDGIGRSLPRGADIVIQVHYHPSGKAESDRTRLGLYFSKGPVKQTLHWAAAADFELTIKAGAKGKEAESKAEWTAPVDLIVHAVTPHMHMRGKDIAVWITPPGPDARPINLVKIDDWDFGWQNTYYFEHPIEMPAGSKLKVIAHFDNSSSNPRNPNRDKPVAVHWGEGTTDEMMIGFIAVTKKGQDLTRGDRDDLREIIARTYEERRKELERKLKEYERKKREAEAKKGSKETARAR